MSTYVSTGVVLFRLLCCQSLIDKSQTNSYLAMQYSPLTSSNDKAPVADLSRDEGIHDHESARIAGLNHPNAKVCTMSKFSSSLCTLT